MRLMAHVAAALLAFGVLASPVTADSAVPRDVNIPMAGGCFTTVHLPYAQGDPLLLTSDTFTLYLGGVTPRFAPCSEPPDSERPASTP